MNWKLSNKSKRLLKEVHPDLEKVTLRALELSPYDFGITEGLRDIEKQRKLVNEGKSTTMNSKHLEQEDGFSHAIDIKVYIGRNVTWEHKYFRKVIQAFVTAAIELGIQLEFGGLWQDFLDSPHIQLGACYRSK